jgi:hypothetical protein
MSNTISWGDIYNSTWFGDEANKASIPCDSAPVGFCDSYNAYLQAIIDRATTEGFTPPDAAVLTAANTFTQALVDAGVWAKTTYLAPFQTGGSLTDFSRINWKSPSGTLATKNSGAVNASGLVGNGTAWSTGIAGTAMFNANGRSSFFFADIAVNPAAATNPIWGLSVTRAFTRVFAGNENMRPLSQTNQTINFSGTGVHGVNIDAAGVIAQYNNGVRGTDRSQGTVTIPALETVSLFLDPPSTFGTARLGLFIAGNSVLTSDEITALFSAYNAYKLAVNA